MQSDIDEPAPLAAGAARLRRILTGLVLFLALVLVTERAGYAGLFGSRTTAHEPLPLALLLQLLLATPAILYLGALWALRQAAAAVASGGAFGDAVVRPLRRVGYCLIAGAALALLVMPWLHRLLVPGHPRLIDYDLATLIIAGIGLGLIFLSRLVREAGAIQAELDQMF
jgi:hypothetical protein